MTKHTQQLVLMLIVGTLLGFAVVKVFSGSGARVGDTDSTPTGVIPPTAEDITKKPESLSSAKHFPLPPTVPANTRIGLSAPDQIAGRTVTVSNIAVEAVSWVAVYDAKDGAPGSILGAAKVKVGETMALVELLRPEGTLAGATYYVAILPDNGDGEFNRLTDLPPFTPDRINIVTFKTL